MFDSIETPCARMDDGEKRKLGSLLVVGQGLLTALAPSLSVRLIKKMLSKNFENTGELEATPEYRRQLRAIGIGTAAAGIAGYAMETVAGRADEVDEAEAVTEDTADESA
jgi:uncharacterized protein YjeT (DUF2065 family)